MRLTPIETVVSRLDDDVIIQDVSGREQQAIVWVDGVKYLIVVVKLVQLMEIN